MRRRSSASVLLLLLLLPLTVARPYDDGDESDIDQEHHRYDSSDDHNEDNNDHEEWPRSPTTTAVPLPTTTTRCNVELMVQCLFEPLDEWAMVLYRLKENIVAITSEQCQNTRDHIRRCVEERAIREYECEHRTILDVAARVTDLLMHKKNSGNLLRSYYVTAFVCSPEGQRVRSQITDQCLKDEKIGDLTFEAMKYIDSYLTNATTTISQEQRCEFLRQRAYFMRNIGNGKCARHREPQKAGRLMCDTLKMAFQQMHPDMFGDSKCDFSCEEGQNDGPHHNNGQNANGGQESSTEVVVDQQPKDHGEGASGGVAADGQAGAGVRPVGGWLILALAAAVSAVRICF